MDGNQRGEVKDVYVVLNRNLALEKHANKRFKSRSGSIARRFLSHRNRLPRIKVYQTHAINAAKAAKYQNFELHE